MEAILSAIRSGELKSEAGLVFSDNPDAPALETARRNGIAAIAVKRPSAEDLMRVLRQERIDRIILAGYLKRIPAEVVDAYSGRIINIHPSLLPRFGGKGFYGIHVHQAVLEDMLAQRRQQRMPENPPYFSGATVHFVDREYDTGQILVQTRTNIRDLSTAEAIARRILILEHKLIVTAVKLLEEEFYEKGADELVR